MTQTSLTRNELLGKIHGSARDLGLETRKGHDRTEYECVLKFLIGRTSCMNATLPELELVADAFAKRADGREIESITFAKPAPFVIIVTDAEAAEVLGIFF